MRRAFLVALVVVGLVGCTSEASWQPVAPPSAATTDEVRIENTRLDDGTYWAEIAAVSGTRTVVFRVMRARFGEDCRRWADENGYTDACMNDYEVEEWPDAHVSLDEDAKVSVALPDGPEGNYRIDTDTLKELAFGADMGPVGYQWTPFPFIVTVENGTVTNADQLWVP